MVMNDISVNAQEELAARAKRHYTGGLPYHNWQHAQDMMKIIADIADRSIDLEVKNRRNLLVVAAAWHDADYAIEDLGEYDTKEQRSADLAVKSLPELTAEQADLVYSGIIDTTVSKTPKSNLFGEVCHLADVGYFAASYEDFIGRLELIRQEWGSPSWHETAKRTLAFGQTVLAEARAVTPRLLAESDAKAWVEQIQANLDSLQAKSGLES